MEPAESGTCATEWFIDGDNSEDFSLTTGYFPPNRTTSWITSGRLKSRFYAIQSLNPGDDYLVISGADLDGDGLSEIISGHCDDIGTKGTIAVDRGRLAFLSLTPSFQWRNSGPSRGMAFGWSLTCTANLADFQPGSVVTIFLSELDGTPTSQVLATIAVDGIGSAAANVSLFVTDILPHTLGMQAVGFDANGQAITTAIERVQFL